MNIQALNLFIVDDNKMLVKALHHYLEEKFGNELNISTFNSGASVLKEVDLNTGIVVLDYQLKGESGNDVLTAIKNINPKTEVIMLSTHKEIGVAIESYRKGATDFVVKGENDWKKLSMIIRKILMYPIRILTEELKVSKFVAIFLTTFITMGIIVFAVIQLMGWNQR